MVYLILVIPLAISVAREGLLIELLEDEFGKKINDSTLLKSKFNYVMDVLVQVGHIVEYTALLIGFSLFLYKIKEENVKPCTPLNSHTSKHFTCSLFIFITLVISLHLGLSIAPPAYAIKWKDRIIPMSDDASIIVNNYGALILLSHLFNACTVSSLIIATVIVKCLWECSEHKQAMDTGTENSLNAGIVDSQRSLQITVSSSQVRVAISNQEDYRSAESDEETLLRDIQAKPFQHLKITITPEFQSNAHTSTMSLSGSTDEFQMLKSNYDDIGRCVSTIQTIFEGWFVAYWVTCLIRVTMDSTNIVKAVTTSSDERIQINFVVTHWIYDISNLTLTYACGQLMNYCHQKYYKELKATQAAILSKKLGEKEFFLQYMDLIPKRRSYQFIPSFCGFSITAKTR